MSLPASQPPPERIRVDQDTLTFRELAAIEEQLGQPLAAIFEGSQARGMAALVWITKRRTDPTFDYEAALDLGPSSLEMVTHDPEAPSVSDGATPLRSLEPGNSTLET